MLLWWYRAGDDEVGNDRDDFTILWIGVLVWTIFPDRFAIHAGYTNHRRLLEDTNGRRLFCELRGRKHAKSTCLRKAIILLLL